MQTSPRRDRFGTWACNSCHAEWIGEEDQASCPDSRHPRPRPRPYPRHGLVDPGVESWLHFGLHSGPNKTVPYPLSPASAVKSNPNTSASNGNEQKVLCVGLGTAPGRPVCGIDWSRVRASAPLSFPVTAQAYPSPANGPLLLRSHFSLQSGTPSPFFFLPYLRDSVPCTGKGSRKRGCRAGRLSRWKARVPGDSQGDSDGKGGEEKKQADETEVDELNWSWSLRRRRYIIPFDLHSANSGIDFTGFGQRSRRVRGCRVRERRTGYGPPTVRRSASAHHPRPRDSPPPTPPSSGRLIKDAQR